MEETKTSLEQMFQAQAFIDYTSKFTLDGKEQLFQLFDNWANSKMLNDEDKKTILRLVEEDYTRKAEQEEVKTKRKSHKRKGNITPAKNDPRQPEFDF